MRKVAASTNSNSRIFVAFLRLNVILYLVSKSEALFFRIPQKMCVCHIGSNWILLWQLMLKWLTYVPQCLFSWWLVSPAFCINFGYFLYVIHHHTNFFPRNSTIWQSNSSIKAHNKQKYLFYFKYIEKERKLLTKVIVDVLKSACQVWWLLSAPVTLYLITVNL